MAKMHPVLDAGRNGLKKQVLSLNPYCVAVLKISFGIDQRLHVPFPLLFGDG